MHWHYPLALAAPLGCLLALLGLGTVAGAVRMVSRTLVRGRVNPAGARARMNHNYRSAPLPLTASPQNLK
jgi:hypothetical protein